MNSKEALNKDHQVAFLLSLNSGVCVLGLEANSSVPGAQVHGSVRGWKELMDLTTLPELANPLSLVPGRDLSEELQRASATVGPSGT